MTTSGASASVETPSGKGSGDENFPVGSFLLPARLRPHVARFYAYARAIDDIADNPKLEPQDKVARLTGFAEAIEGGHANDPRYVTAHRCRASLLETGVTTQHCLDLIAAFKQDAVKLRYDDWNDLMGYCFLSASPVGRYLLDLHGEDRSGYLFSDALCNALQVLNHLQDCQTDYRALDRVYLPQDWMCAEGATVEDLNGRQSSPGLRRVIDRCLTATETLNAEARKLPGVLSSTHLAMESAAIVRIAIKLTKALQARDPVAGRVQLTKLQFMGCCAMGVIGVLLSPRPKRR